MSEQHEVVSVEQRLGRALAEVERLRVENGALIATLKEADHVGYWQRKHEIAQTEIERLRDVLQDVIDLAERMRTLV